MPDRNTGSFSDVVPYTGGSRVNEFGTRASKEGNKINRDVRSRSAAAGRTAEGCGLGGRDSASVRRMPRQSQAQAAHHPAVYGSSQQQVNLAGLLPTWMSKPHLPLQGNLHALKKVQDKVYDSLTRAHTTRHSCRPRAEWAAPAPVVASRPS